MQKYCNINNKIYKNNKDGNGDYNYDNVDIDVGDHYGDYDDDGDNIDRDDEQRLCRIPENPSPHTPPPVIVNCSAVDIAQIRA